MQIDLKYCKVYLKDGSNKSIEVTIGEGNLTWDEKRAVTYTKNRGKIDTCRLGDEEPMDVKMDATWEYIKGLTGGGAIPTIEDVLKHRGAAADWVSSSADACEPFAVDIEIVFEPVCSGVATKPAEVIVLPDFRYEQISHDLKAGTFSISGKCNATEATSTRMSVTSATV